jgi:hypothetical protein
MTGPAGPEAPPTQKAPPPAPGFNWDPVSWVESGADWTQQQLDSAVDWTYSTLGEAAGWTVSEVSKVGGDVASFVEKGLTGLAREVWHVAGSIHATFLDIDTNIKGLLDKAESAAEWIGGEAARGLNYVESAVSKVYDEYVKPLEHDVATGFDTVRHDVATALDADRHATAVGFDDVRHSVATVADSVASTAKTVVDDEWHNIDSTVIQPLEAGVDEVTSVLGPLVSYGISDIVGLLNLVKDAGWFLIKVGEWSVEGLEELPGEIASGFSLPSGPSGLGVSQGDVDTIESWLSSVFGLGG